MTVWDPLVDRFGRVHENVRISVTERCNIRCFYCMPDAEIPGKRRAELLTFEEIERVVRVLVRLGIRRLRLTGGEPLLRRHVDQLIARLAAVPGVRDLALTTNGMLLAACARDLVHAGLQRINISLDTLQEATFQRIARRPGLDQVLAGIAAARSAGFQKIRLNAVAIRDVTEADIVPLGRFAREQGLELRFIEFMPLDADGRWDPQQVLPGALIRQRLAEAFGPLVAAERRDRSQPAVDYDFADGRGRIGFINPVSEPFCDHCNRLRVSADGRVRNCLFGLEEWDLRRLLRGGGTDEQIARTVRQCVAAKKAGHGIDTPDFLRPPRAMYELGG